MKVRLLHPDSDFDPRTPLPPDIEELTADLELKTLYTAMADGDGTLFEIARNVVPRSVVDPDVIGYRQDVLGDCFVRPDIARRMYAIADEAIEARRKMWFGGFLFRDPGVILNRSVELLGVLFEHLRQLRTLCDENAGLLRSAGFRQLFAMIDDQLDDDYFTRVDAYLTDLRFPDGVLVSAELGTGNRGRRYRLHRHPHRGWWDRLIHNDHSGCGFEIAERDQAGARALVELAGHGLNDVADTTSRAADHVQDFFTRLRYELGFYLGCLNLHEHLVDSGVPTCFPTPATIGMPEFRCTDLRDVGLCLTTTAPVTGNDVAADGKRLIVITGANEGGKSTFLRSVGTARMMLQAGMFVTATMLRADVRDGIFTHFKREEDATMTRGKFDAELARMSTIVDHIGPGSLLLCNESFASTNEREGSQIAREIVHALVDGGVEVVYVTHLYDLAHGLYLRHDASDLFLRAERRADGTRTFHLLEAEPEPTSHGEDSFRRVFATEHGSVPAAW